MVKLKFIVLDGVLALRISENKARYYKRVTHLLKGKPNLEKHWVKEKERFSAYATSYAENNQILEDFKAVYWKLITEHPELTAKQVANYYKSHFTTPEAKPQEKVSEWPVEEYKNSVEKYLETVILREKAKQGCNHETYYKLLTRCRADIPGFDTMAFSTIDYNKMVGIAYIFARKRAYRNTAKSFRALLGRAHKDKDVMFNLGQIGTFCFSDYNPDRYDVIERHPDVLSDEQLRLFMNFSVQDITPSYKDRKQVELYYDFCVFMFHTFFSPCDVIKVKRRDITRKDTLLVKRKKTHRTVEVPITPIVRAIIDKYKGQSKDGYIFPIMDDEHEKKHATKDYTYKKFREYLNIWLKEVGKELEVGKSLMEYNPMITYPVHSHFYKDGEIWEALRSINGVKRPTDIVYWKELDYDEKKYESAQPYSQLQNWQPGDIVTFANAYFECLEPNGLDFNDIRIPGINAWQKVEVYEWQPNLEYNDWEAVSYDGKFYALLNKDGIDLTVNPFESDNWGLIGSYDETYPYELKATEYVEYNGSLYIPTMLPVADELKEGYNIRAHDPRNANIKKHMVRLALYELHKLISPNNISSARITDYEISITWLRDANRMKINPQIPRKLDDQNKPTAEYAIATFQRDYDPYQNPWQI